MGDVKIQFGRTLKQKLSIMTLLSTLVPLLFLGLLSYTIASNLTEEKATMSGEDTLQQLKTYLEFMVQDVENMSVFLIGNKEVQEYLLKPERNFIEKDSITGFLTNLAFSKKYIANINLKAENDGEIVSTTAKKQTANQNIFELNPGDHNEKSKRWSSLDMDLTATGFQRLLTFSRSIRSLHEFREIGQLAISLDQPFISNHLQQTSLGGNGFILLLDENDHIIAGPRDEWLNSHVRNHIANVELMEDEHGFYKGGTKDDQKTILYANLANVDWKLVGVIPTKEYRSENSYFLVLLTGAICFAMLLGIGLVLFLTQKVIAPLTELTRALKKSSPEEPVSKLPVNSNDEVGQLIKSYNSLNKQIEQLMDQVKLNESLKKEVDLLALQAQINPHFLYNTLSSIQWMALMNKDSKTAEMVSSLSDFLRFSLNNGKEFCAVSQEIAHVENYVNVQSIRYPDKFDVQIEVDPALQTKLMLKLLLQPLIENAMLHGILKKEGIGKITVFAELHDKRMTFTVTDNGVGMNDEQLKTLCTKISSDKELFNPDQGTSGGFGLRNVQKRLVLHYGENAGLKINSKEGKGTEISFTIPVLEE